jgi:hypothetical protein
MILTCIWEAPSSKIGQDRLSWPFLLFLQTNPEIVNVPYIRPRPLRSTSLPIHFSLLARFKKKWKYAYEITLWSVCVSPLSLLGNGSVNTFLRHRIHTKNCWTPRFLCGPCRIKGKLAINSSQNFLFHYRPFIWGCSPIAELLTASLNEVKIDTT